ncbi:MAG: FecR domain-containing protein [Methylobacter sp.]|nr:FecR domain-containing protein [Methylobacter sp.]
MNYNLHFFKQTTSLLWLLFFLLPSIFQYACAENVAHVIFAKGEVYANSDNSHKRDLIKGSTIEQGDIITTKTGYVQLRFTDGGLISFYDNTEFKVADYHFSNKADGTEKAFFQFVKGAFRTVVGSIGKERYQVKTNLATIGTRGTEYSASLDKVLQIDVFEGKVLLNNQAGSFLVQAGHSALVQDVFTMPQFLNITHGNHSSSNQRNANRPHSPGANPPHAGGGGPGNGASPGAPGGGAQGGMPGGGALPQNTPPAVLGNFPNSQGLQSAKPPSGLRPTDLRSQNTNINVTVENILNGTLPIDNPQLTPPPPPLGPPPAP